MNNNSKQNIKDDLNTIKDMAIAIEEGVESEDEKESVVETIMDATDSINETLDKE